VTKGVRLGIINNFFGDKNAKKTDTGSMGQINMVAILINAYYGRKDLLFFLSFEYNHEDLLDLRFYHLFNEEKGICINTK
jgi:hypothetical protein